MHNRFRNSNVSSGIFLIGAGILAYTGWWWPGILIVIGLSSASALIMRGQYLSALFTFAISAVIPLFVAADIHWQILGPFILVALGAVIIFKSLNKKRDENKPLME